MSAIITRNTHVLDVAAANEASNKIPVAEVLQAYLEEDSSPPMPSSKLKLIEETDVNLIGNHSIQYSGYLTQSTRDDERLLNARQVADRLGVSERFIRDHTTRRSPKIPAVKLGKLIRYRRADVESFMAELNTLAASRRPSFRV